MCKDAPTITYEKIKHEFRARRIVPVGRHLVTDRSKKGILSEGMRKEDMLQAVD